MSCQGQCVLSVYQVTRRSPGTASKSASRLRMGSRCWIAREATSRVRILVTTKIGHAELGEGGTLEVIELVHFMADMIDA